VELYILLEVLVLAVLIFSLEVAVLVKIVMALKLLK
jgi:hypothetical protein